MSESAKKLYYRKSGATGSAKLYTTTDEVGADRLGIRSSGATIYAKLGATSDSAATPVRVRKSGATYAILSQADPTIVTSNLIMHLDAGNAASYPGTGTTWTDLSGVGNHATLINSVGYSSDNNGTLVFNTTQTNVRTTTSNFYPTGSQAKFTLSMWCKRASATEFGVLVNTYSSWSQIFIAQYNNGGYAPIGAIVVDLAQSRNTTSGLTWDSNTWYNVVLVRDGTLGSGSIKLYRNNTALINISTGDGQYNIPSNCGPLEFGNATYGGSLNPGCNWSGRIAQIAMYNRALSSTEVTQNYDALKGRYGL